LVHLDDKEQVKNALLEIDRVLTTGGFLYVSMQNRDNVESGWVTDEHSKEGRFFQFFNLSSTREIIEEIGYKVIDSFSRVSSRKGISWSVVFARK